MSEEPLDAPSKPETPTTQPQGGHGLVGYAENPDEHNAETARAWQSLANNLDPSTRPNHKPPTYAQGNNTAVGYNVQPDEYSEQTTRAWESLAANPESVGKPYSPPSKEQSLIKRPTQKEQEPQSEKEKFARDITNEYFEDRITLLKQALGTGNLSEEDTQKARKLMDNYEFYKVVTNEGNLFVSILLEDEGQIKTRLPAAYSALKGIVEKAKSSGKHQEEAQQATKAVEAIEAWMQTKLDEGLKFKSILATEATGDVYVIGVDQDGQEHRKFVKASELERFTEASGSNTNVFNEPSNAAENEEAGPEDGFKFRAGQIISVTNPTTKNNENWKIVSALKTRSGNILYGVVDSAGKHLGQFYETSLEKLLSATEEDEANGAKDEETEGNYKFKVGQPVKISAYSRNLGEDWIITKRWMEEEPVYILTCAANQAVEQKFFQSTLEWWLLSPEDGDANQETEENDVVGADEEDEPEEPADDGDTETHEPPPDEELTPEQKMEEDIKEQQKKLQERLHKQRTKKTWWGHILEKRKKIKQPLRNIVTWVTVGFGMVVFPVGLSSMAVFFAGEKKRDYNVWRTEGKIKKLTKKQENIEKQKKEAEEKNRPTKPS